jgi:glycerol uptake facilitator protein
VATDKLFGEFYPDPGGAAKASLSLAMGAEALGTFLLVLMIFALTEGCNVGRPDNALTQAGLNPARDFGPRLVAWWAGWGAAAFPDRVGGFFYVYVLSPVLGAVAAARFFVRVLEPAMREPVSCCACRKDSAP